MHPDTHEVEDLGLATAATIYGVGQHAITEFWNIDNPMIARASHIHPEARPVTSRRSASEAEPEVRAAAPATPKAAPAPKAAPPKEPPAPRAAPLKAPPAPAAPPAPQASEPVVRPAAKILAEESEEVLL